MTLDQSIRVQGQNRRFCTSKFGMTVLFALVMFIFLFTNVQGDGVCNGVPSTDPCVCSARGECFEGQCLCANGFTGENCEFDMCYGYSSHSELVCNGHGVCKSPDNCQCHDHYFGDNCQWYDQTLNPHRKEHHKYGNVSTYAGSSYGYYDGPRLEAQFQYPSYIVFDFAGDLIVADQERRVLRKVSQIDDTVSTIAGSGAYGDEDGSSYEASFKKIATLATTKCGEILIADEDTHTIRKLTKSRNVETIAGIGEGYLDGPVTSARFSWPWGMVVDKKGDIFVADAGNNVIRNISGGSVTTFVGSGEESYLDAVGLEAHFNWPDGLEIDDEGNLYVGDYENNVIRKVTPNGNVTTYAGVVGEPGFSDGELRSATFRQTIYIKYIGNGNLIVRDRTYRIRLINQTHVTTIAGTTQGFENGEPLQSKFDRPGNIDVDRYGNIFVADPINRVIRKVSKGCEYGWTTKSCNVPVCFGSHTFDSSHTCSGKGKCVAPDQCQCEDGYFGEACQNVITCFGIPLGNSTVCSGHGTCVSSDQCQCSFGYYGQNCNVSFTCSGLDFSNPCVCSARGSCVGNENCTCMNGYFGSNCEETICYGYGSNNSSVCSGKGICKAPNQCECQHRYYGDNCEWFDQYDIMSPQERIKYTNVTTFSGSSIGYEDGGPGIARFSVPTDLALDFDGNLIVSDLFNRRLRKVSPQGQVTTIAGTGGIGYLDGPAASAILGSITGVAIDQCGEILMADRGNNVIRKLRKSGMVETFSGNGEYGMQNGPIQSATFNGTWRIAVDNKNDVFITEDGRVIRKISNGEVSTFAGSGGDGYMDGVGTQASFGQLQGINTDNEGNVYVVDVGNLVIRKISPDRNVTTLAGTVSSSGNIDGELLSARFDTPFDITVMASGNYLVVDVSSNRIRMINETHVSTLTGSEVGFEDGPLETARFFNPTSAVEDRDGNIFITDAYNHVIRKITRVCQDGWITRKCNVPVCFGIQALDNSQVCSGKGKCIAPNQCVCDIGFHGDYCQNNVTCFGKDFNAPSACSGNGNCTGLDTCVCNDSYYGANCENFDCYGFQFNDTRVCNSGNGTCVSPNNCHCNEKFSGDQCHIHSCYMFKSNDPLVCSGRGECIAPDYCQCNPGYIGLDCNLKISCYGIPFDNNTVCSGRGVCEGKDSCKCNEGYLGEICEVPLCYGIPANNVAVCSNMNGTCTANDTCQCNENYIGNECQNPVCFGVPSTNDSVCSSNGQCVMSNLCRCNENYVGLNCEVPLCYGFNATDELACSSKGLCISANHCICQSGYLGDRCENHQCFGVMANLSQTCSGNGVCLSPDVCSCNEGWVDSNCQIPVCHGINATDPNVCSGNGSCISPNNCSCSTGFTEGMCLEPICFGKNASDPNVCTGQGLCNGPNSCICKTGYYGETCEEYDCMGHHYSSTSVCSHSNGTCTQPNTCICNQGYTGEMCEIPICFGLIASNQSVCSEHGSCSNYNQCTCNEGYFGSNCEHYNCYGVKNTDSSVCTWKNGTCVSPDNCLCKPGYTGELCNIPICHGYNASAADACSSHGKCTSADHCQCEQGYMGDECQFISCNGVMSTNSSVCSGRGNCTAIDTCNCNTPMYGGVNCDVPTCYGVRADSFNVCNARGKCIIPNTCQCREGYEGSECEILSSKYNCFGVSENDPMACSGNGICIANNSCNCTQGFTGERCQYPTCYGKSAGDALNVCSGNGQCSGVNRCECKDGFFGDNCETIKCYGKNSTDPAVCSKRGVCVLPDSCLCDSGFVGECNVAVCFGRNDTDKLVCSERGTCTAPNQCQCNEGSFGSQCQFLMCFGKSSTDRNVCSGAGQCKDFDYCECTPGRIGNQCEIPICFGIPGNDTEKVCNGNGNCLDMDMCECQSNEQLGYWAGLNCSRCSPNYSGEECKEPICNANTTCSSNGECNEFMQCVCHQNTEKGFWRGQFCDQCVESFYGPECKVQCNQTKCSYGGTCNSQGGCSCFDDDRQGRFTGEVCEKCQEGWMDVTCTTYIGTNFTFSDSGDRIFGELLIEGTATDIDISCDKIIHPSDIAKIGSNPLCRWSKRDSEDKDFRYFEIIFGENPTLFIGDNLQINIRSQVYQTLSISKSIKLNSPLNPQKPISTIGGPASVGFCDDVELDGSFSSSPDRRRLNYIWKVESGFQTEKLSQFLSLHSSPNIMIPADLLQAGFGYVFSLTVSNYIGIRSEVEKITVHKSNDAKAVAFIRGPSRQTITVSSLLRLEGNAIISSNCFYSDREILYTWSQTKGERVLPSNLGRVLLFHPYTFSAWGITREYEFQLKVQPIANLGVESIATVTVVVEPQSLVAIIRGGGRRVISDLSNVTLDASPSYDPDNVNASSIFMWSCTNEITKGICHFSGGYTLPSNSMTISIPPYTLQPNSSYIFSLIYSKGSRSSETSVVIEVTKGVLPEVFISTILPLKVNSNDRVIVESSVIISGNHTDDGTLNVEYEWKLKNSMGVDIPLTPQMSLTNNTKSPVLALRPNSLQIGQSYTFTLVARVAGFSFQQIGTSSTERTLINEPPRPGVLEISPKEGTALETMYVIRCMQFTDEDLPLSYAFAYVDHMNNGNIVTLSRLGTDNSLRIQLPVGNANNNHSLTIIARVVDVLGASVTVERNIIVRPLSTNSSTELLDAVENHADSHLNDAVSSGSLEAVGQIIGSVTQMINIPSLPQTPQPSPEPGTPKCINDCSGNGICQEDGICSCNQGFVTSDCSITEAELRRRRELRFRLLNTLVTQTNRSVETEPLTAEIINQHAAIVNQVTNKPEELTVETQSLATNYLNRLLDSASGTTSEEAQRSDSPIRTFDQNTATSVGNALSNIVKVAFRVPTKEISTEDPQEQETQRVMIRQVSEQLHRTTGRLLDALLTRNVPGEEPQIIDRQNIQLKGQRQIPRLLDNLKVSMNQMGSSRSRTEVRLPPDLSSSVDSIGGLPAVDVRAINYQGNPYSWSPESQNISSSVVSFSLKGAESSENLRVHNLTTPIVFVIPGNFERVNKENCIRTESLVPSCRYWDTLTEKWKTDGCQMVEVTNNSATCMCNHLTDFAVFAEMFIPKMNILTPEDFALLAEINHDNALTLYIMISFFVTYVFLMICTVLIDWRCRSITRKSAEHHKQLAQEGRVSQFIETIREHHIWISTIFRPLTVYSFTRPQRITVVYIIILGALCASALFFNVDSQNGSSYQQDNIFKEIVAGIIANLCVVPAAITFGTLFSLTCPSRNERETIKTSPEETFSDAIELEEYQRTGSQVQMVPTKEGTSSEPSSPIPDSTPQPEEIEKRKKKREELYRTISSISLKSQTNSPTVVANSPTIGSPSTFTIQDDNIEKDESLKEKLDFQKLVHKADYAVDVVEAKFTSSSLNIFRKMRKIRNLPCTIIVLLLCLSLYFAILASLCVAMTFLFPTFWQPYFNTIVGCISILILALGFEFIYFSEKREIFKVQRKWAVNKISMMIASFLSIAFMIGIVMVATIAVSLRFWDDINVAYHCLIVSASLVIMVLLCIVWIVLHLRKPKLSDETGNMRKKYREPLPWWSIFWIYPLAWLLIAAMSTILVVYSLKFGPELNKVWLMSSMFGIGNDIFIMQPLDILFRVYILTLIIDVLKAFLLNWEVNSTTSVATIDFGESKPEKSK